MSAHRYLVVGNPVAQSRSPEIHRAFAAQFGEDIDYSKVVVEPSGFADFVDDFARSGGRGLNVTVPFKVDAYRYVDDRDAQARAAGSVNTIALAPGLESHGFNTDGIGLLRDLNHRHGLDLADKTVLILGAGGAAQGVMAPIMAARPRCLMIANRTLERAQALVARHVARSAGVALHALAFEEIAARPDIIINATSAGGAELIDPMWVKGAFCYDMSYGDAALFCDWSQSHGAGRGVDGLGMLVEQAAESYFLWRGDRPRTDPVLALLRSSVG